MIPFRCHSLSEIMAEPKKKGEVLSEGAKTYCRKLAKQLIFGVKFSAQNKFVEKGLRCEDTSIELLNLVRGSNFTKNTVRHTDGLLTGEPDIIANGYGIDIKTSWSLETFPITEEEAHKPEYEWQCRGYMRLFNLPRWGVAYCMVDTPPDLCRYDPPELHRVFHIPPEARVTTIWYERDAALEDRMCEKVCAAREFLTGVFTQVKAQHALLNDLNPSLATYVPAAPNWANDAARAAFS